MERVRAASFAILSLGLLFWVVALGGLSALVHTTCAPLRAGYASGAVAAAKCAQAFAWQWWTLWFALFLMGGALALTLVPVKHLLAWRAVMAHFFTMLALLCMTAANYALPLFVWPQADAVTGGDSLPSELRSTYYSGSALSAGWVVITMCAMAWIVASHMLDATDLDLSRLRPSAGFGAGARDKPAAAGGDAADDAKAAADQA